MLDSHATMRGAVFVNGKITSADQAVVPVLDHGFLYGEGVYETLRTYNRVPFLYERHVRRLRQSADHLSLPVPFEDAALLTWIEQTLEEGLRPALRETIASSDGGDTIHRTGRRESIPESTGDAVPHNARFSTDAYIRLLLTRGVGELTYDIKATPTPSLVIIVKPLDEPTERVARAGIKISLVDVLRNHPQSVNPIIKSNNLLNNALAMQAALARGGEEALMCNYRGELSECAQSNFFIVRDGAALTPRSEAGLLEGVTRAFLFEVGREIGIDVRAETLYPKDLDSIDEAFITSTTRELSPVVRIDDRVVGSGQPGPVTLKLLTAYQQRAELLTRRDNASTDAYAGSEGPNAGSEDPAYRL
jgi:branched-chain amino acid aminotransferase